MDNHTLDADPRRPLYWLAEFLRQQGIGLRAGQVVITGSLAGAPALPYVRSHYPSGER